MPTSLSAPLTSPSDGVARDGDPRDPRDLTLEIRGMSHHVALWGDGPRTLLLLHGWLDHARLFDKLADRLLPLLGADWRIAALDFRGHGDSGHVEAASFYHFPDYVADVHAVMAALVPAPEGDEARSPSSRLALVGHSMGGMIALQVAGTSPERISHLAVIESLGPPREQTTGVLERMRGYVRDVQRLRDAPQRAYTSVEEGAARVLAKHPRIHPDDALHYARHALRRVPDGRLVWKFDPRLHARGPWPWLEELLEPFMRAITAPLLFMEGSEGFRLDDETRERRLGWAHSVEQVVIEGAGHHVHLDAPDAVAAAVSEFLRRETPPNRPFSA